MQNLLADSSCIERAPRTRLSHSEIHEDHDFLAVEEPLEIRVGQFPIAVVMRTPGHDEELATGFALTEGIVRDPRELARVAHCSRGDDTENVIVLTPSATADLRPENFARALYASSSCGICGKQSLQKVLATAPPLSCDVQFSAQMLTALPGRLREQQPGFDHTGSLHAAGLSTRDGMLVCVREDIGRHNAVDKVVGWAARTSFDSRDACLVISGRCSFEVVQKALAARIPCVVAVGGVSSLAANLATAGGITLMGFTKAESANVYSHARRVA